MKNLLTCLCVLLSFSTLGNELLEKRVSKLENEIRTLKSLYTFDNTVTDSYMDLLENYNVENHSASRVPQKNDLIVIDQCFTAVKNSKFSLKLNKIKRIFLHPAANGVSVNKEDKYIVIFTNASKQKCYDEIVTKL